MIEDRGLITIDLLIKELESLKRARDILYNIYVTNDPYTTPTIQSSDWQDMQNYFGFDDSE